MLMTVFLLSSATLARRRRPLHSRHIVTYLSLTAFALLAGDIITTGRRDIHFDYAKLAIFIYFHATFR